MNYCEGNEQLTYIVELTTEWSNPIPIEYGKDIVIKLSKAYVLIGVRIAGGPEGGFERVVLGGSQNIIHACVISHIRHPELLLKAEERLVAEIELRQPND